MSLLDEGNVEDEGGTAIQPVSQDLLEQQGRTLAQVDERVRHIEVSIDNLRDQSDHIATDVKKLLAALLVVNTTASADQASVVHSRTNSRQFVSEYEGSATLNDGNNGERSNDDSEVFGGLFKLTNPFQIAKNSSER
jgi:hypothetical protein